MTRSSRQHGLVLGIALVALCVLAAPAAAQKKKPASSRAASPAKPATASTSAPAAASATAPPGAPASATAPVEGASPADAPPEAVGAKIERGAGGKKIIRITSEIRIEGKIQKPEAFYVLQKSSINYEWQELKQDFLPRILDSVSKSPF